MPKVLCIIALAGSLLFFVLFAADLVLGMSGNVALAPFRYSNMVVDIVFVIGSGVLGALSWLTLREQV